MRHPKRLLFLDIDGVLNSFAWEREYHAKFGHIPSEWTNEMIAEVQLDPKAVQRLNCFCRSAGCQVVISSMWRTHFDLATISKLLRGHGFKGRIISQTPKLSLLEMDPEPTGVPLRMSTYSHPLFDKQRSLEIETWICHNYSLEERHKLHICIVDDMAEMGRLSSWFIQTKEATGWLDEHSEKLALCLQQPLGNTLDTPSPLLREGAAKRMTPECCL